MAKSKKPTAYLDTVAACDLFIGIARDELAALLTREGIAVGHFARGETIYAPQGFSRSLGIILGGSASVRKKEGDASMFMSMLAGNDLFGAALLFSDEDDYVAYIVAEQSTWALLIPEACFRDMMRENHTLAENYMRYLTARIRFLSGRIDGFVRPGCEERVLRFLRQRAESGNMPEKLNMSALAEALCISRASLYRVLDSLEERNAICRNGRQIELVEGEKQ